MRPWNLSIPELLVWVLIIGGCIAVVAILLKAWELVPPKWFISIVLVVAAVFVGIVAIRLIASM